MGGIVDGGAGIGIKTSPRRAAIEKAQAELRQEYDVREKRRRELEFLEKGGNPLDFKFGNVASVSGQSTSPIDRHPEQFVSCEAKGSFALTASPHGDSIESSGRPGAPPICEPNSADNLLLFDSENELPEGSKKSMRTDRKNFVVPSVQSSHMDGSRSAKESEESAIFRPYARRNRSRLNRDGARLTSGDPVNCRIGHGSSMAARASSKDSKGPTVETNNHREQNARVAAKGDYVSTNGDMLSKVTPENCLDVAIDDVNKALESSANLKQMGIPEDKSDVAAQGSRDEQCDQSLQAFGQEKSVDVACGEADLIREGENIFSDSLDHQPSTATANVENEITCQLNSVSDLKRNDKLTTNEIEKISTAVTKKGLDSESSCAPSLAELKTDAMSIESSGTMEGANSEIEKTQKLAAAEMVVEHSDIKTLEGDAVPKNVHYSSHQMHVDEEAINGVEGKVNGSDDQLGIIKYSSNIDVEQATVDLESKGSKLAVVDPNANQEKFSARPQESADQLSSDIQKSSILEKEVTSPPKLQVPCNQSKLEEKMHEDSVLEEARMIEAKRKRIAELSVGTIALERRKRSHWDFVLEEMAWLANDFVQERLWKMTTAAQLSHRIACYSRFKIDQQSQQWKIRKVAYTLAKAVMQFWHSAEALLNIEDSGPSHAEVSDSRAGTSDMKEFQGSSNKSVLEIAGKQIIPVQRYAVQFLRENNPPTSLPAEVPKTPDRMSYSDSLENSWENHLTEESLFYTVPPGAMETYRKSIESYVIHREKVGGNIEEVNKSAFDVAEYGYQENAHNELEGETSAYYLPGAFEGSRSLKFAQKKRKNPTRSFDVEPDFPYGHCTIGSQPPTIVGKRTSNLVGPVPTKRFRSASRPRVIMPSSAGASMGIQPPTKTDASSGDTNSFQDEHTTLQGMPRMPKSMEVDSVGDFEKQLSYDLGETSTKTKKKKKGKNLVQSSPFNQGWQLESPILGEQREQSKRRLENHQFESNGTSGLYGQQNAKKQKTTKHSIDNTLDNIIPMSGSISSPMAAQSISNQNKLMKYISGRDRSKKAKLLKAPSSQPGSGSPWTVFEDQALVVLVHDMGPNWELVSDAINSTLQFKCIFRNPRECKERHKSLMDRTAGDGADSAEDSGSSQSYPSTLPGIPKGSARQLFQRLQGPVEEDTIREHFDKIIQIGQKPRQRRVQIENQDSKQIAVHNSHFVALSQVCPNNLNGVVLTPLDLCAEAASNSDVLPLGYQGSHGASLPMPNQGAVGSMLPMSGVYPSPVQGSGGMVLGTNLLSPAFNASIRDGRYNVQRPSSLPADEQQRMQQHNQTVSARTMQQSNLSIPGALSSNNRGRMLPNGNGMGVASAMNRNSPMPRPGFQGLASSSGLNPSNMLSSGMVGVPSTVNMHAGSASNQATSMMRPREALHMMRPGHNLEQQRQMTLPELQMQATQGSSQGIPPINGLGSSFSNQMTAPVQTFPGHSQQQHQMPLQQSHAQNHPQNPQLQGANHAAGSQHQAYAMRLKERQLQQQQRYMQPQQQLAASGSLMPHVQSQSQLPTSLHSSPQIHPRPSSQSAPISPLTPTSSVNSMPSQTAQKHQMPAHGLSRSPQPNVGGLSNQMSKQRQRPLQQQQLQHLGRNHPQQRQQVQAQAQQQAKLVKGVGRGTALMQQNMSAELSHSNGLPVAHGRLGAEKELMRGQGLYPETSATPIQTSKPLASQSPNHFHLQQHLSSDPASSLSKQQQVPSHSDRRTEVQTSPVPSGQSSARAHQSAPSPLPATNHLEVQLQHQARQKQVNQSPIAQRVIQQNRQITYEPKTNAQTGQVRGEQKPVSNSLQAGTSTALPQASNDSVNMASLTPLPSQWKASDSVYEPLQPASQRILPDGSASRANNIGVLGKELQKQQPNLKQSSASPPSMQQHFQTEEQPSQLEQ